MDSGRHCAVVREHRVHGIWVSGPLQRRIARADLQQAVEIGNAITIASLSPNFRLSLCPDRKVLPGEILDVEYTDGLFGALQVP